MTIAKRRRSVKHRSIWKRVTQVIVVTFLSTKNLMKQRRGAVIGRRRVERRRNIIRGREITEGRRERRIGNG